MGVLNSSWGGLGGILGAPWEHSGRLGRSWGHLGVIWGGLGGILGAPWGLLGRLGRSWDHLGVILGDLGPSWADLRAVRGALGVIWGPLVAIFGSSWAVLGAQKWSQNGTKIDPRKKHPKNHSWRPFLAILRVPRAPFSRITRFSTCDNGHFLGSRARRSRGIHIFL